MYYRPSPNRVLDARLLLALIVAVLVISARSAQAQTPGWQRQFAAALKNGGAIVEREARVNQPAEIVFEHRAEERFVPASTIKIATVAAALHYFGREHRFETQFYLSEDGYLGVKGQGDPHLVSEELAVIAKRLAPLVTKVAGIQLDDTFFEPGIVVDGAGNSLNPYDASYGALLANFNTVNIRKSRNGQVASAEPQTPLTAVAREAARRLPAGTHRVNIGQKRSTGLNYFAQLLTAFLQREGVQVGSSVRILKIPETDRLIYTHVSSKNITELSRELLDFSTNFLANQLFLLCGAAVYGPPANVEKAQRALIEFLETKVGWRNFSVVEGAGLSRKNRVTPRQMLALLDYFSDNRDLLPLEQKRFLAKTGSLRGVNTLAGYMTVPGGESFRYVMMVNDNVAHNYRFVLANKLYDALRGRK